MQQEICAAKKKRHINVRKLKDNASLTLLILPGVILTFIFCYLPMFGVVIAFKEFNPNVGIFASKWVGFDNFKFFFQSNDFTRIMRNTVLYGIDFLAIDTIASITLAILVYNVKSKLAIKYYQTTMILPNFLSMVLVAYVVYALLNPVSGIVNKLIVLFGGEMVDWYARPGWWPMILTVIQVWKSVGMGSILYYAVLIGIDESLFEAARIDGAAKRHEIKYIIIPELMSLVCIQLILGIGRLISGDFGLFYQVPMNIGALYPTTDIINTYVFRALTQSTSMGRTAAVGLFQSFVGMVLVVVSNLVVKKIDADKSLF